MTCGLIGRRLGHSYSPQIHRALADYDYKLWELEPEKLEAAVPLREIPERLPLWKGLSEVMTTVGLVAPPGTLALRVAFPG